MGVLVAMDPASKVAYTITEMEAAGKAINELGYILLRPDGSPGVMQSFEGGILLDGAPLNVYLFDEWYVGQRELLEPHWTSGTIPRPPQDVLMRGVVQMPEDVRAHYEAFKAQESSTQTLMIAGVAALGLFLLTRR